MTIHFAPALPSGVLMDSVLRAPLARLRLAAANDNDRGFSHDALVKATLRHFALHGLSAARRACVNAERAFHEGKLDECRRWLAICRMLDRRMAATITARVEAAG